MKNNYQILKKTILNVLVFCLVVFGFIPAQSSDSVVPEVTQRLETKETDIPKFKNPVCLLVGINSSELSYQELSNLSGFEFFSVPYRVDVMTLADQLKPAQVIIKHPSGFAGLYSNDGALIRGVQTQVTAEAYVAPGSIPESIIKPVGESSALNSLIYPGLGTGIAPHGGVGYVPPAKTLKRHFLKLASYAGLFSTSYPYPTFDAKFDSSRLFPGLVVPQIPHIVAAGAAYSDAKLDQQEYEQARIQPREYMFQPIVEGY